MTKKARIGFPALEQSPRTIVYIAGHARTGSTAIDMMLGGLPNVSSLGEWSHLPRVLESGGQCTCGLAVQGCRAWDHMTRTHFGMDAEIRSIATRRAELRRLPHAGPTMRKKHDLAWRQYWIEMTEAAWRDRPTTVLVDSSKSLVEFRRREYLLRSIHADVRTVVMRRRSDDVARSAKAGPGALESDRWSPRLAGPKARIGLALSTIQPFLTNRSARKPLVVWQEDLAANPEGVIDRLSSTLSDVLDAPIRKEAAEDHAVGGNQHRHSQANLKEQSPAQPKVRRHNE